MVYGVVKWNGTANNRSEGEFMNADTITAKYDKLDNDYHRLKIADFLELTGWSRTTLWRRLKEGKTPKPLMEDGRLLGFTTGAYKEWLKSMQA